MDAVTGAGAERRIEMPILSAVSGLAHGFTVRGSDALAAVRAVAGDAPLVSLRQVHGSTVRIVPPAPPDGDRPEGDALATDAAGLALGVWVADCVPALICDPRTRAVAAVHAGWRGTVAGIVGGAIATLRERFGSRPADLRVALGPAIGPCCFEVGDEVVEALLGADAGADTCVRPGPRAHVDLAGANRRQAIAAGVPGSQVESAGLCTVCRPDLLESYRRDRQTAGRMAAFIAWRS
jgi:YfiH family protein